MIITIIEDELDSQNDSSSDDTSSSAHREVAESDLSEMNEAYLKLENLKIYSDSQEHE